MSDWHLNMLDNPTPKCDQAIERANRKSRERELLTPEAKRKIAQDIRERSLLLEHAFAEGRWKDAAEQAMTLNGHLGLVRHLAENLMETERRLFT